MKTFLTTSSKLGKATIVDALSRRDLIVVLYINYVHVVKVLVAVKNSMFQISILPETVSVVESNNGDSRRLAARGIHLLTNLSHSSRHSTLLYYNAIYKRVHQSFRLLLSQILTFEDVQVSSPFCMTNYDKPSSTANRF